MAQLTDGRALSSGAAVDTATKALRTSRVHRGQTFRVASTTGTMAAALGANSSVFVMRIDPGAGTTLGYITSLRLQYTTIVAYTTPITAGRRLAVFRGAGAASSGGTGLSAAFPSSTTYAASQFDVAEGGDMRIATTAALTITGITYEAQQSGEISLVHLGTAGASQEFVLSYADNPIILQPGQLIAIRNPAAMDAAGTWQLTVTATWYEAVALESTTGS